jgi:hypothetical protein
METLELPVTEQLDEVLSWPDGPPVDFAAQDMDIAAFKLWREASRLETATDRDATETEERA